MDGLRLFAVGLLCQGNNPRNGGFGGLADAAKDVAGSVAKVGALVVQTFEKLGDNGRFGRPKAKEGVDEGVVGGFVVGSKLRDEKLSEGFWVEADSRDGVDCLTANLGAVFAGDQFDKLGTR